MLNIISEVKLSKGRYDYFESMAKESQIIQHLSKLQLQAVLHLPGSNGGVHSERKQSQIYVVAVRIKF